jgi:hypothetical protein
MGGRLRLPQRYHLLPRILHLSNTRVSILPEGEEFLIMLYGFAISMFVLSPTG